MYSVMGLQLISRARVLQVPALQSMAAFSSPPPVPKLPPDINFKELQSKIESKSLTLIDVRTTKELDELGSVPGSINIPLTVLGGTILLPAEDFTVRMGVKKPSASDLLVTMCMGGVRAKTAQLALTAAGYTNVRRYKGSFEDWVEKGGAVIKPSKEDLS